MKTVAIVALKGGTGKSAVTSVLAVAARQAGRRIMVADTDPQASLLAWSKTRQDRNLPVMAIKASGIYAVRSAADMAEREILFVDTRSSARTDLVEVAKLTDLSLIVVRPTLVDLRAVAGTVELLKPLGVQAAFVLNQAPPQRVGAEPMLVKEAVDLLLGYGVPIAPVALRSRVIYQSAFALGRSPQEIEPSGLAAAELARLWTYVAERLGFSDPAS